MFLGRGQQLKSLHKVFERDGVQVSLIYGRRRIGKSELLKQAIRTQTVRSIYYECKQTTEQNNVESLSGLTAELFGLPPLGFGSIEPLLEYLFNRAKQEPLILVLDEYPYLHEKVAGMDSILQALIDRFQEHSGLKLVLCGSFVDVMKSLLMKENPLFGRVDLCIDLKPMDYYDSALFYPNFSDEDKVRLYSVFGGVPYYNRLINSAASVRDNIIELVASPGARLENEVGMYLRSEIGKINNANETFEALARGFSRFSDILSQSHVSSSPTLADVLDRLIRMELVRREAPINDSGNKRRTGYFISDNLSMFWYRYCFRYASQMSVLDPDVFFNRYIAQSFESSHVPYVFEEVCRQYLIRMNRLGHIDPPFSQIGRYSYDNPTTHTNGEFDVVTSDPLGYVFYEAKFSHEPITRAMVDEEIAQVNRSGLACRRYGFFSRAGFDFQQVEPLVLIPLEEMYR